MNIDEPKPQLYRSRKNRMIAGIAGGLAEYFNLDLSLVRFLWVLAFFLGGGGFLAYLVAWVIIPEEPKNSAHIDHTFYAEDGQKTKEAPVETREQYFEQGQTDYKFMEKRRRTAGLLLIGVGAFLLLSRGLPFHLLYRFWPSVLIGLGVLILIRNKKGE